jgi:hypothetical protein
LIVLRLGQRRLAARRARERLLRTHGVVEPLLHLQLGDARPIA